MGWRAFAVRAARVNYVQRSRDVTHVINSPRLPSPLFPYTASDGKLEGKPGYEARDLLLTSTCKQIEKTNMVFTSKDERPLGKPQVPEEVYGHTSHTSSEEVEKRNNPSRRKDKTMTLNTKVPSASTCTKTCFCMANVTISACDAQTRLFYPSTV